MKMKEIVLIPFLLGHDKDSFFQIQKSNGTKANRHREAYMPNHI